MIISISTLQKSVKKYNKEKIKRENYNTLDSLNDGVGLGLELSFVVISLIFTLLEFLVLLYSLLIAIRCTKPGPERVIHVVLAISFTLPYALLNVIFNKCAKKTLRGK